MIFLLLLNSIGFLLAFKFWWTDSLSLSFLGKEVLVLLFSTGICWIGILFLSIIIGRTIYLKPDSFRFVSPLGLVINNSFINELGIDKVRSIRNIMSFTAPIILTLTITGFFFFVKIYKKNQLKSYGIIEKVKVKGIRLDVKKNPYIFFRYNNGNDSTYLPQRPLITGDEVLIIYSGNNPDIVEYYYDFQNE